MVTSGGMLLEPNVTIPSDALSVSIGRDGTVSVTQPGSADSVQVGQIQLADFINPAGLNPVGENLFTETVASGAPVVGTPGEDEFGAVFQGSLETSNVNVVEELVSMIETQRAYEMNSKAISTTDEMLSFVTQQL
jgi:flagellar basal-body rod protein FlgG